MANERARALGFDFVTDDKYLRSPFKAPVQGGGEDASTESFGIPATQAFTNSGGGGGGGNYSGGNFQQVVDDRQDRLNDIDTSTFMGKAKDFMNPQSAKQIMDDGYQEPRFQPGIIGTMMGKFDNYRNLPQADQAFIAQNMGYTGPTIFGENNSGLSKDEFGINTRSAFGNYAEYVKDLYKKDKDKVYDPKTQAFKYKRKKFNDIKHQELLDTKKELAQQSIDAGKTYTASLANAPQHHQDVSIKRGDHQAQAFRSEKAEGIDTKGSGMHGGKHYAKGGRAGYFFGGRARLQGGGMSQGKEANIDQSTNMGGGASGDYSTMEQNMNHREAMRNNQREQPSTLNNTIDTGSELNYLNNLKNLNLPGLALGFGFNKIRNYLGNKKDEDDKLSALPTNNYMAKVTKQDLSRYATQKDLIDKQDYSSAMDTTLFGSEITPYEFKEMKKGNITEPGTYVGASGGRVNFKNGGLASIL